MATDALAQFKAAQRAGWAHFTPLQALTTEPAARLVKYAGIGAGDRVLALPAEPAWSQSRRRAGERTSRGLDLTPELLETARENARIASVNVEWHEGDVEALPFDAESFDAVVSQYGHIFAPRPDVAAGEMLACSGRGCAGVLQLATGASRRWDDGARRQLPAAPATGHPAAASVGRPERDS